jgi:hypothetical protein
MGRLTNKIKCGEKNLVIEATGNGAPQPLDRPLPHHSLYVSPTLSRDILSFSARGQGGEPPFLLWLRPDPSPRGGVGAVHPIQLDGAAARREGKGKQWREGE